MGFLALLSHLAGAYCFSLAMLSLKLLSMFSLYFQQNFALLCKKKKMLK
jgi:hypothetical protein